MLMTETTLKNPKQTKKIILVGLTSSPRLQLSSK